MKNVAAFVLPELAEQKYLTWLRLVVTRISPCILPAFIRCSVWNAIPRKSNYQMRKRKTPLSDNCLKKKKTNLTNCSSSFNVLLYFFFSNVGLRLLVMDVQRVLETLLPFQKPSGMQ